VEQSSEPEHEQKKPRWVQLVFGGTILAALALAIGVGVAEDSFGWGIAAGFCAGVLLLVVGSLGVIIVWGAESFRSIFRERAR